VILSPAESEPDSHYINANYVDSFKKVNAYIATQGKFNSLLYVKLC